MAICLAAVFAMSVTAYAAETPAASGNTNALAGVNITILDTTTPATMYGFQGDVGRFTAADGRVLGTISTSDADAIIRRVVVADARGRGLPPGEWPVLTGSEWSQWFAAEFNRLRGIGGSAGQSVNPGIVVVPEPTGPEPEAPAGLGIRFSPEWMERERGEVIRLVNIERDRAGLPRLEANDSIMQAAQIRAIELAAHYSHERPDGSRWVTVFEQADVSQRPSGENIHRAMHSAESAMNGWMRSEGHRNNILREQATTIGVGFYRDEAGRLFWVQVFGR